MVFEELYDRYFRRIYNYVRYRVLARDAADDIVSAVFEKVLDGFGDFDQARPVEPWLFAIARNTLNDHYRRGRVRGSLSTSGFEEVIPSGESVERGAEAREENARLLAAMAGLSENERELIAMRYALDLSTREMSAHTGLSESNVGVTLFRAIKKLRDRLGPEGK
ncbi:MAG: sigma-70 family RNA polymerase sigma factor [Elusimicrobia bacterium]|nr:sigma-70 family RNA polymerase sigma factor [Elusimicrobiota bacterium]MDA8244382.1 sigma-70 family RNA polymerase sigma factor [Elusimicrobiota bacterium]